MGVTKNDLKFFFYAQLKQQVSFRNTLMLGRLELYASKEEINELAQRYQYQQPHPFVQVDKYSEPLFKFLGAEQIISLDYSNYEGATLIHDMNTPVPESLHRQYSCVIDSGTLEHVFNFPIAIKNSMNMVAAGGHYLAITPTNNQMGHGFYQFSPELYYRIFSPENGFQVKKVFITTLENDADWFEVEDPKRIGNRGMVVNQKPLCMMILAQKINDAQPFSTYPIQSDYATTWQKVNALTSGTPYQESRLKFYYRKLTPHWIKRIARNTYDLLFKETVNSPDLGVIEEGHFKKFDPLA